MGCTDHRRRDWVVICGTGGLSNDIRPALERMATLYGIWLFLERRWSGRIRGFLSSCLRKKRRFNLIPVHAGVYASPVPCNCISHVDGNHGSATIIVIQSYISISKPDSEWLKQPEIFKGNPRQKKKRPEWKQFCSKLGCCSDEHPL